MGGARVAEPWKAIVDGLAKHGPDALLAFALGLLFLAGLRFGYRAEHIAPLLALLWLGYVQRQASRERHLERMAEIQVQKIEAKGKNIKDRYRQKQLESREKGQARAANAPRS